eukprot:3932955-Rhodomonas_salina.2
MLLPGEKASQDPQARYPFTVSLRFRYALSGTNLGLAPPKKALKKSDPAYVPPPTVPGHLRGPLSALKVG